MAPAVHSLHLPDEAGYGQKRRSTDLVVVNGPDLVFHVALLQLPPVYEYGLRMLMSSAGIECSAPSMSEQCKKLLPGDGPLVAVVEDAKVHDVASWLPSPSEGAVHVVHVLPVVSVASCEVALHAGATGVLALDAAPSAVVDALRAAAEGKIILPSEVAREICRPQVSPRPQLSWHEVDWLRSLAHGATVMTVARAHGYSERELYRRLASLYERLGATGRTEALIIAERSGLLAPEPG